ncbi:MAG: KH domain-containing protein [Firmicutes bacterium]|nr:KH domain-containing protein [Bacillota bacterium]
MKDLLEFVARQLVSDPDAVQVHEVAGQRSVVLELRVAPDDLGKVIGRQGRVAKAIRALMKAAAARDGRLVHVEIMD